ncbi:MAG: fumarylacetoacetate hydrolase family protein [Myxococcota bacterium]|nr:fumarylacetoacetate hydrolase family protein [Myxococcota bacterium]
MKLGTLRSGGRDGTLVLVSRDGKRMTSAEGIAPTLQHALDNWETLAPKLEARFNQLESGSIDGEPVNLADFHSPLPRAYEWVDGSAYINHVVLVRKARNAEPPATLETDPLVYQGGSGVFLPPHGDIPLADPAWGLDFESEVCVVLGDTPQGVKAKDAEPYVRLVMICNDITLRGLIPNELKKGFGFFNGKPATAFAPFAVTPDELGPAWKNGRMHLNMKTELNGKIAGDLASGPEMHFSFFDLIQHIAKTRAFTAGTILGSGTVSNMDTSKGSSCLSEKRMLEIIAGGDADTAYLRPGDSVRISVSDESGNEVFGHIAQTVVEGTMPAPGAQ